MSLFQSVRESGLVLVEESRDEAGLRRALKQIDSRLRLLSPEQMFPGTPTGYWRVVCQWSNDAPAAPILTWMTTFGDPLPLSSRLLDEVNRHRMDAPGGSFGKAADERNADLVASVQKQREDDVAALHDEYEPYLARERVGVAVGARNKIPYWKRQRRGGYVE
jgi:hypothetical protein